MLGQPAQRGHHAISDPIADRFVCSQCALEPFLSADIEKRGGISPCFYCTQGGKTFSLSEVADCLDAILKDFYTRVEAAEGHPVLSVIAELPEIADDAADDIRSILADRYAIEGAENTSQRNPFDRTDRYVKTTTIDTVDFDWDWYDFE